MSIVSLLIMVFVAVSYTHLICLIFVCMSFFLTIVEIALQIKNPFYKLIAIGLGAEYAFQVFLTIGGATKFIPMTGVTLPLVSYGGSCLLYTSRYYQWSILSDLWIWRILHYRIYKRTDRYLAVSWLCHCSLPALSLIHI